MAIKLQAERVMAGIVQQLCNTVRDTPQVLTQAFRSIFTHAPAFIEWTQCADERGDVLTGCWVAEGGELLRDVLTVNLLSGAAMRNANAPSHLPESVVSDPVYREVFQNVVFDATPQVDGQTVTYRTAGEVGGYVYTWCKEGDRLLITETFNGQTLELLPCAFLQTLYRLFRGFVLGFDPRKLFYVVLELNYDRQVSSTT